MAFLTSHSAAFTDIYNSKFILTGTYLGTNAIFVTRVHCTFRVKKEPCLELC